MKFPPFKSSIKNLLGQSGIIVRKIDKNELGHNQQRDIEKIIGPKKSPVIFDVGANIGQSVVYYKRIFPDAEIHCFEPLPLAFGKLKVNANRYDNVVFNNYALGKELSEMTLNENSASDMSSFLKLGEKGWGEIVATHKVNIDTLDNYCKQKNIAYIDLLKIDTQGFDYNVLLGARKTMDANKIRALYMEFTLQDVYDNTPRMDTVLKEIFDHGFKLVCFYNFHQDPKLFHTRWTDGLFIADSPLNN
jgi:FkbM family methyltransferase